MQTTKIVTRVDGRLYKIIVSVFLVNGEFIYTFYVLTKFVHKDVWKNVHKFNAYEYDGLTAKQQIELNTAEYLKHVTKEEINAAHEQLYRQMKYKKL